MLEAGTCPVRVHAFQAMTVPSQGGRAGHPPNRPAHDSGMASGAATTAWTDLGAFDCCEHSAPVGISVGITPLRAAEKPDQNVLLIRLFLGRADRI
jgi:hypothetical protein